MLEWAGISFGEEETFKLGKSLKRLAVTSGAGSIKFCGKMYITNKDYWLASGHLMPGEEHTHANCEKRGEGVNQLVFWVTDNLLNDWIQLPDCRPEHIACARMMQHVLTGDLNATIDSNPPFPGKERHYLRAQLARIFAATTIIPKGLCEFDEETKEVKFAEDFAVPGTEELKSLEAWGNLFQVILKAGTMSHIMPAEWSDEKKEEEAAKLEADDKSEERFRALNEHAPIAGMETAWLSKVVGDTQ